MPAFKKRKFLRKHSIKTGHHVVFRGYKEEVFACMANGLLKGEEREKKNNAIFLF